MEVFPEWCYILKQVYPNMRAAVSDILQRRGFRGLYAGLTPTLIEIVPYAGLQFGTYDTFKRWTMVIYYDLCLPPSLPSTHTCSVRCTWSYLVQLIDEY